MRALYTALFYCGIPFILARLYWRGGKNPDYRRRLRERFGWYPPRSDTGETVWIHAVSVGEVESAIPLVRRLLELRPGLRVVFTTTTPTGSARVRAHLAELVEHGYLPYDLPGCVERFLRRFRPRAAVILETEIWPNLFAACSRKSIPLFIVNGRLSERSATGYRSIGPLVRDTLNHVTAIAAQTERDAGRFAAIGAAPHKVTIAGNIKFDLDLPEDLVENARLDRQRLFPDRPVLIAASTHDGEEEQILALFGTLLEQFPTLLLILVPRHPERFAGVAALCRDSGYATVCRSEARACEKTERVLVLDTMGELKRFYAAADLAFVGGSLVPVGGHNVLEPAAVAVPVLFGPHVENFREICSALVAAGGALQCENSAALAAQCASLLAHADRRAVMGADARSFVTRNRGALDRVVALLEAYLPATIETGAPSVASPSSANSAGLPMK